jgi:hypothetical protein
LSGASDSALLRATLIEAMREMGNGMEQRGAAACRHTECGNEIPHSLSSEQLCLEHFLDEAFTRTDAALQRCRTGQAVDAAGLEWLLADALAIVNNLDDDPVDRSADQQERMLELLLILANLHEYVAQKPVRRILPA